VLIFALVALAAKLGLDLVGAAIISTIIFPLVGLRLRAGRAATDIEDVDDDGALVPVAAAVPATGS
jgi:hypothetical protein